MNEDLFKELKKITGWKYEICVGSKGYSAFLKKDHSNESQSKTGKNMDELALWIIDETRKTKEI